jgi:hypothetical protein
MNYGDMNAAKVSLLEKSGWLISSKILIFLFPTWPLENYLMLNISCR